MSLGSSLRERRRPAYCERVLLANPFSAPAFRVDSTVLPLLFLGLLVFQLDRMNLASALTDGFAKNIGIDQATVNLGNQLMFMGIVVFEIPCNMALQKVGSHRAHPQRAKRTSPRRASDL